MESGSLSPSDDEDSTQGAEDTNTSAGKDWIWYFSPLYTPPSLHTPLPALGVSHGIRVTEPEWQWGSTQGAEDTNTSAGRDKIWYIFLPYLQTKPYNSPRMTSLSPMGVDDRLQDLHCA